MRLLAFVVAALTPVVALAQEAASTPSTETIAGGSPYAGVLPLAMIAVVFYFLLLRPQQARMKEHQTLLGALKKGDEVVTAGGIIGKITRVNADDTFTVEIAKSVEISVVKSTISGLHGATAVTAEKNKSAEKKLDKKADKKNDNAAPSRDAIANDN